MSLDPLDKFDTRRGSGRPLRDLLAGYLSVTVKFDMTHEEVCRARVAMSNEAAMAAYAAGPDATEPAGPTEGELIVAAAFATALRPGGEGVAEGPARVVEHVVNDIRGKGHDAAFVAGIVAARPEVVERLGRELFAQQQQPGPGSIDAMKMSREELAAFTRRGFR